MCSNGKRPRSLLQDRRHGASEPPESQLLRSPVLGNWKFEAHSQKPLTGSRVSRELPYLEIAQSRTPTSANRFCRTQSEKGLANYP